jgi:hypothetical protein
MAEVTDLLAALGKSPGAFLLTRIDPFVAKGFGLQVLMAKA